MTRNRIVTTAAALSWLALAGSMRAAASLVRLRGFVVEIESPTRLVVDDYGIAEDRRYRVRLDAAPPDIHVGSDVQVEGSIDSSTGEVHAATVVPRVEPFKGMDQRVILSSPPHDGMVNADGRHLRIVPSTRVQFVKSRDPLTSLDQVDADVVMTYKASRRELDGRIVADEVGFRRNETEPGERELWKRLQMDLKEPDFEHHKTGGLRIYRSVYYGIIANLEAQRYVSEIGWSLVPGYQRRMADGAPSRIPFKFYVVNRDEAGAVSLQNGVVVIYSRLFDAVENEAQLAAVIGHEVAHVIQKHRWQLAGKIPGAFNNSYGRALENQADRLGMQYMTDAGYDPREASRVYKVLTKRFGFVLTNAFGGSHDNHALRREYLMRELEQNYRDLDYSSMKTERDRFARVALLVKGEVDPTWKANHSR